MAGAGLGHVRLLDRGLEEMVAAELEGGEGEDKA